MSRPAVYLDRDGTIIEDGHYLRDPEGVRLIPRAIEALKRLREKGYLLFVVSNQSGVCRGIIKDEEFRAVHNRLCDLLAAEGVSIDEYGYCFHQPEDHCLCRKPNPGLIRREFEGAPIDLAKSFTVGDKPCDVELAQAIGATGCLVLTGKGEASEKALRSAANLPPFRVYSDLAEVAEALPAVREVEVAT